MVIKDKWVVTLEIETTDGDPRWWDWSVFFAEEDAWKMISSEFKGRVHFPTTEEEE